MQIVLTAISGFLLLLFMPNDWQTTLTKGGVVFIVLWVLAFTFATRLAETDYLINKKRRFMQAAILQYLSTQPKTVVATVFKLISEKNNPISVSDIVEGDLADACRRNIIKKVVVNGDTRYRLNNNLYSILEQ